MEDNFKDRLISAISSGDSGDLQSIIGHVDITLFDELCQEINKMGIAEWFSGWQTRNDTLTKKLKAQKQDPFILLLMKTNVTDNNKIPNRINNYEARKMGYNLDIPTTGGDNSLEKSL